MSQQPELVVKPMALVVPPIPPRSRAGRLVPLVPILVAFAVAGIAWVYQGQAEHTGRGITVGSTAPDFDLQEIGGTPIKLSEVVEHGPVLVVFYQGTACAACTEQLQKLAALSTQLRAKGVQVVAVSEGKVEKKGELPFAVVEDRAGNVGEAWGLRMGGMTWHGLFLVGKDRRILWEMRSSHAYLHPEDALEALGG